MMIFFKLSLGALAALILGGASEANAAFKLCNTTSSRIGVAIGYVNENPREWVSEGWWNVPSQKCEVLLPGDLVARYYYVHAIDYDRGGEWGGKAYMCTDDKEFTVRGIEDCAKRGFKRTGFFEVDTQEEKDWTVRLTDTIEGQATGAQP
ncbi:MAG: DUF1036 domain-containing protein [Hyphomicrobiales bacterium]|nr:DUF1036 domain-containing protein [Hyphomicrobiales bacterium]